MHGLKSHSIAVLTVFLLCIAFSQAHWENVTICITNEEMDDECIGKNATCILQLSDLQLEADNWKDVHILLTSGTHLLSGNLDFNSSVENMEIKGINMNNKHSKIKCKNESGIQFNVSCTVKISDIIFENCGSPRKISSLSVHVALHFINISYELQNVQVKDTKGYGLYSINSAKQVITDCTFFNTADHASNSHSKSTRGIHMVIEADTHSKGEVNIYNCIFNESTYGAVIRSIRVEVSVQNCTFTTALKALMINVASVRIENCTIKQTTETGVFIDMHSTNKKMTTIIISKTDFQSNARALLLQFNYHECNEAYHHTNISSCKFENNTIPISTTKAIVEIREYYNNCLLLSHSVVIEKSDFFGNKGTPVDCSSLHISNSHNVTLSNTNFTDNECTGITLVASNIIVNNQLKFTNNSGIKGGAIQLLSKQKDSIIELDKNTNKFSWLTLNKQAQLILVNNHARKYGGAIFTDKTCENRNRDFDCIFQFKTNSDASILINSSGNKAEFGGDVIFGGCFSDCHINSAKIDVRVQDNIFWNYMSIKDQTSSINIFAERPQTVVFCKNTTFLENLTNRTACKDYRSYEVSAYRGQKFNIPLMVVDDLCSSFSSEIIIAKIEPEKNNVSAFVQSGSNHDIIYYRSNIKYCENHSYSLIATPNVPSLKVQFSIQNSMFSYEQDLALLTVNLIECPTWFKLNISSNMCVCDTELSFYGIECTSTHSLKVPATIWIGEDKGKLLVHQYCKFCKTKEQTLCNISKEDSDKLCSGNRAGILCGACVNGYSLQLGGYTCADCSKYTYRGILLPIFPIIGGIILVIVLISLNLTISTGLINGLILYSNIVHFNSESFLPINRDANQTHQHLQNIVQFLSTFQAWMNFDLGIDTCFFNGFDKYSYTWMQYAFPLYSWLLILLIVFASRYSSKVSKLIASNIVPVLATLMLLSYSKITLTSISVYYFERLHSLDGTIARIVWTEDGNILYAGKKHLPLFLMSLFMTFFYILPFTLLILFGPLLQTKSNYKLFKRINRLKPFLDAFYGPYTSSYRVWPGVLLLSRFTLFTPNSSPLYFMTVTFLVILLLIIWIVLGKNSAISPYHQKYLNYLELFFLLNLATFAIVSGYLNLTSKDSMHSQQVLAVVMVGGAFVAFCGIMVYQIIHTILQFKSARKAVYFIFTKKISKGNETLCDEQCQENRVENITSQSTLEMKDCMTSSHELREPLLAD